MSQTTELISIIGTDNPDRLVLNKSSNFLHHLSKEGGIAAGVVSFMMAIT
ncbi:MAG: hypothetical protein QNJ18_12115 [Xenococcaceae cyanobacterium MO_167.B52]|nr:hypothetical protein [Xenococcaceae cyanobacterium MO_167.B52]